MAKGEIAHCEQFLILSQCFQKASTCGKGIIPSLEQMLLKKCSWKRSNCLFNPLSLIQQLHKTALKTYWQKFEIFPQMRVYSFKVEKIVVKSETAHHEQFLLLPHCFQKSSAANAPECVCKWERVNK